MGVPTLPLPWTKVNELYVTSSPSKIYGAGDGTHPGPYNAVYVQTQGPNIWGPQQQKVWHPFDLRPFGVGEDAFWALLAGMVLTTHGSTPEIADGYIGFRKPGDASASTNDYIGQVVEAAIDGGQRCWAATGVPLTGGVGEFCFWTGTGGTYPLHPSYGFNFSVQAWAR